MKRVITFAAIIFFLFSSFVLAENGVIQSGSAADAADTAAGPAANTYTAAASLMYWNALGIELVIPGRSIPGISYTRFIRPDIFATAFAGLITDRDGVEALVSINGYKMFNEFFYAGLGFGTIFDRGRTILIGIANPSVGLMARITQEITIYAEGTAWLLKVNTNNNMDELTGNTLLVFKAGVKYNFKWSDPLPDINDMIR